MGIGMGSEKFKVGSGAEFVAIGNGFKSYVGIRSDVSIRSYIGDENFRFIEEVLKRNRVKNFLSNNMHVYTYSLLAVLFPLFLINEFVKSNGTFVVFWGAFWLAVSAVVFATFLHRERQFPDDSELINKGGERYRAAMSALVDFRNKLGSGEIALYVFNNTSNTGVKKGENISRFNKDGGVAWIIREELGSLPIKTAKFTFDDGVLAVDKASFSGGDPGREILQRAVESPSEIKKFSRDQLRALRGAISQTGVMDENIDLYISVFERRVEYYEAHRKWPVTKSIPSLLDKSLSLPLIEKLLNGSYEPFRQRLELALEHAAKGISI
jgi:hypothetical protein